MYLCITLFSGVQHINSGNYFQYQEEARLDYFSSVLKEVNKQQTEFDVEQYISAKAIGPILGDAYCKVRKMRLHCIVVWI